MRANHEAHDREPRPLRRLAARTSVVQMRILILSGVTLLAAVGGPTPAGAAHEASPGKTAVKIRVQAKFLPSNAVPSGCVGLTFGFDPAAPVLHADVTEDTELRTVFRTRQPATGEPHRTGGPPFQDATLTPSGISYAELYCPRGGAAPPFTIEVHVSGIDRQGQPSFVHRIYNVIEVGVSNPHAVTQGIESSDHQWQVHCANC
jgi:hypothetical protein